MKTYSSIAILYRKGDDPWLWSPYESLMSEAEAQEEFQKFLKNYPDVAVVASWMQEYDHEKNTMKEYGIKYYVNVLGFMPRGNFTIETERRIK